MGRPLDWIGLQFEYGYHPYCNVQLYPLTHRSSGFEF